MSSESQIQEHLAETIKQWRKMQGVSQATLAEKVGMHQTAIAKIENCERKVDFATVVTIAQVLEIPWNELFVRKPTDVEEVREAVSTILVNADKWIEDMARSANRMREVERAGDRFLLHLKDAKFPSSKFDQDSLKKASLDVVGLINLMREKTRDFDFVDEYDARIEGVEDLLDRLNTDSNASS